jgi:hypothetical protein
LITQGIRHNIKFVMGSFFTLAVGGPSCPSFGTPV